MIGVMMGTEEAAEQEKQLDLPAEAGLDGLLKQKIKKFNICLLDSYKLMPKSS